MKIKTKYVALIQVLDRPSSASVQPLICVYRWGKDNMPASDHDYPCTPRNVLRIAGVAEPMPGGPTKQGQVFYPKAVSRG